MMYRKHGKKAIVVSLFSTFLISGFWHGAGLNFILWGAITGVFFIIPSLKSGKRIKGLGGKIKGDIVFNMKTVPLMLRTAFLSIITFAMFRSNSIENMSVFFKRLIFNFGIPSVYTGGMFFVFAILILDYLFRKNERKVMIISKYRTIQYVFYYSIIVSLAISFKMNGVSQQFIYFQF